MIPWYFCFVLQLISRSVLLPNVPQLHCTSKNYGLSIESRNFIALLESVLCCSSKGSILLRDKTSSVLATLAAEDVSNIILLMYSEDFEEEQKQLNKHTQKQAKKGVQ